MRRPRRDPIAAFQYLKRAYRKAGEGLFTRACSDKTKGNGFKLEEGRFKLDVTKQIFTVRVVRHWTRLLKAPSNLALNTARDGASTTSLGDLFQCLTTLTVRTSLHLI